MMHCYCVVCQDEKMLALPHWDIVFEYSEHSLDFQNTYLVHILPGILLAPDSSTLLYCALS